MQHVSSVHEEMVVRGINCQWHSHDLLVMDEGHRIPPIPARNPLALTSALPLSLAAHRMVESHHCMCIVVRIASRADQCFVWIPINFWHCWQRLDAARCSDAPLGDGGAGIRRTMHSVLSCMRSLACRHDTLRWQYFGCSQACVKETPRGTRSLAAQLEIVAAWCSAMVPVLI